MDYDCVPLVPFAELECFPKGVVARLVDAARDVCDQDPQGMTTAELKLHAALAAFDGKGKR